MVDERYSGLCCTESQPLAPNGHDDTRYVFPDGAIADCVCIRPKLAVGRGVDPDTFCASFTGLAAFLL